MKHSDFVHLHLHTQYSLLDGACRINDVVEKAHDCRMPAVAITDHGNMFGAIDFYQAAQNRGLKPIIGCETYIAPGSRLEKKASSARDAAFHLVLLAKDQVGYRNLIQLVTSAHLDGFYYKPRIDKDLLQQHSQGLIGFTSCLKGEVPFKLMHDQEVQAQEALDQYRQIFAPGDFYVELQDHGLEDQHRANRTLLKWAREFNLPLVATNDVHYIAHEHHHAHDALICLQTQSVLADEKRMRYASEQFYLKTPEEMHELFAEVPEALRNTIEIAEKCNLLLEFGTLRFPNYDPPDGFTREAYLRHLCQEGIRQRYDFEWARPRTDHHREVIRRVTYELGIIEKQKYTSYFLIVWDFVNFARQRGIPVGPGRGSAAGSVVAYLLGITNLDPLRYNLLFERFLNPERVSPPDIDMDFCYNRRPEVIDYVRKKYGEKSVAQIITFGTLGAKMVVRDVGRVMSVPYAECDRVAKMIPFDPSMTLRKALEISPDLKTAYDNEETVRQIIDTGFTLEGLARNVSTHAAGVVIGAEPLTNLVPLTTGTNSSEIVTQYAMNPLGELGLLKMDFLGLKTLTVIDDTLAFIKQTTGEEIDMDQTPLDDQATFDLIKKANTIGVFQLESGGMRDLCRRIGIESIDNINALVALYRPGPMQMIDSYIARKHGQVKIEYDHPLLEPILKETYGIFVYQEQVMQATSALAGYSLGGADILRRAMGKKKVSEMEKQRKIFIKGCHDKNQIPRANAEAIFDTLARFAGYGFNKSHSAAYAVVAYHTAYLKANYPVQFMAALLSNELTNTDKIKLFINECQQMDIEVLPPDVNFSGVRFQVESAPDGTARAIRFGLAAIKGVGEIAVRSIIDNRRQHGPFPSLDEFCTRIDLHVVNRKVLECLVKCGALDSLGLARAQMFDQIEYQVNRASAIQRDRDRGQGSLFDLEITAPPPSQASPATDAAAEWSQSEMLAYEKELLGFYVTGHPLTQHAQILRRYELASTADLAELQEGQATRIGGILSKVQNRITKQGRPMAIATLEDLDGIAELLVFPDAYARCGMQLKADAAIFVRGKVDRRDEQAKVIVDEVIPLPDVPRRFTRAVHIRLPAATAQDRELEKIRAILDTHPGQCPVFFCFMYPDGRMVFIETSDQFFVTPNTDFIHEIEAVLGEQSVWLKVDAEKMNQLVDQGRTGRNRRPAAA